MAQSHRASPEYPAPTGTPGTATAEPENSTTTGGE